MLSGQPQTSLFLLQKDFVHTKTQIKPKQTNKIKLSKQKTTTAKTSKREKKLVRGCPDNLIYNTTESKILLVIFIGFKKLTSYFCWLWTS